MEELDDLLYNDTEAKFLALQNKKEKRKHRKKRLRWMIFVVLVLILTFYFASDSSKIKHLNVGGNVYYSQKEVLKKAGLSYNTRYIVMPKFYIEWKLNKDPLIEEIKVSKHNGGITLQVKERMILGYFVQDDKNQILLQNGTILDIESENLSSIVDLALIDGFNVEQLDNLAASFRTKDREVNQDVVSMISEMHPYSTSYDKNMIRLIMQDGNEIYTDYASMPLLNDYKDVVLKNIKKGKKNKVCVFMDDTTASLHTEDCKEFQ